MTLKVFNLTGNPLSYLSGNVTVTANGTTTVPDQFKFELSLDGEFRRDVLLNIAQVMDSTNKFGGQDAISYLHLVATITQPISSSSNDIFTRIKNREYKDIEEARYDIPAVLASGFVYVGIATNGTATSSAAWNVVRTSFDSLGNPTRDQYRTGVVWDNRATGW